ncbi:MAG: ATP-binding cassette domain-containing protein [Opitutaceae bacterium]|nr:ATP-binding cassette domain-containing protein [Opitutaceae bacterium]
MKPSSTHPLIELRHIYKFFGGLCATNDVSLTVNPGEVIGLVGDNAAGKSTLMKIIAGVHAPTEGEYLLDGRRFVPRSPRDARDAGIEMVFQIQDMALVPELDVADNLFLGKELYRRWLGLNLLLDRRKMQEKSRDLLRELGINIPTVTEKVKHLSGGQQQSVSIARTVFFDARLVILDEPTSSISITETRKVLDLILELKRKGVSSIIVSHRMDDIFSTADRIIVLRRGRKIEDIHKEDTTMEEIIKKIVHAEELSLRGHA